jgi:hypothetical protein
MKYCVRIGSVFIVVHTMLHCANIGCDNEENVLIPKVLNIRTFVEITFPIRKIIWVTLNNRAI